MLTGILHYSTIDFCFLDINLKQLSKACSEIIVPICERLFNGEVENKELLKKSLDIISKYPKAKAHIYEWTGIQENTNYYHNLSREIGTKLSNNKWLLFVDADEIIDDEFYEWFLENKKSNTVYWFTCYWYFRCPTLQATTLEGAGLLIPKKDCIWDLYHPQERSQFLRLEKAINGYENHFFSKSGKPLVHHFSWVRTKEEMLKKVYNWGHKNDRNWRECVEEEFSRPFNGKDFIHNYNYRVIKNQFNIQLNDAPEKSIPVIGTAIVNSPKWVKRLIDSVDYPTDLFIIFNNNGRGEITAELDEIAQQKHKFIKQIKVCHLPSNLGTPATWNLIIKTNLLCPYWVITNHDIQFTPGFLKTMAAKSQNKEVGIVYGERNDRGTGKWDIFLIKDWVVQKYGLFDDNFYPAYVEDIDYDMRLVNSSVKLDFVELPYFHGEETYNTTGSQTWRSDLSLKNKIDRARIMNETIYMNYKWGNGWRNYSPYKSPFNNEQLPKSFTTFDLNFLRDKYLGF